MTTENFISQDGKLSYRVFGTGKHPVLAFHGYGQSAVLFEGVEKRFPGCRIYAFDLFFHGQSPWPPPLEDFTPQAWQSILSSFLKEKKINDFSLLAFSLGGRVACTSLRLFPKRVRKLYLLAPDGIHTNLWYQLSTGFPPLRRLFRKSIRNPEPFLNIVRFLRAGKLLNKSLIRLAERQMADSDRRKRVYSAWMAYRKFKVPTRKTAELISRYGIRWAIVAAEYDRLISADKLRSFSDKLPKRQGSFKSIECGHYGLFKRFVSSPEDFVFEFETE